ncbi:MAG: hypothetical protein AABX29_07360 [Nanoarchaeota archaeon]
MIICDKLTYELLEKYGHRKKIGRLSVLTNPKEEIIYVVPMDIEHIDYAKEILNTENIAYLFPFPLIPSHIHFDGKKKQEKIIGLITGESGLEQSMGKIHTHTSLNKAHNLIWKLILEGEVPIGNITKNRIIFDYVK